MIGLNRNANPADRPPMTTHWKSQLSGWAAAPLAGCLPRLYKQAFGILMYHRVIDPPPGFSTPTWNVPPCLLRQQLTGLLKRGYDPWPLRRVLEYRSAGRPIPRNVFVVTFDDGYLNNLTQAYPILKDLEIPATVFLATAYLDSPDPFPSDDWADAGRDGVPAEAWRPLTTEECRTLAADGLVELAAHTHSHCDFRGAPEALQADLELCCEILRDRFGVEQPTFAFPYGTRHLGFSGPPLMQAAKRSGVCCALTTEKQLVRPQDDPFDWGRHTAGDHDTAATLAAKLSGWYDALRKTWQTVKPRRRNAAAITVKAPTMSAAIQPPTMQGSITPTRLAEHSLPQH